MKKKSLLIMLASLFSILQGAWAENTPQVIWCKGNTTLYFINSETEYEEVGFYDGQYIEQVWSGTDVTATPTNGYPAFNAMDGSLEAVWNVCTRVVFDKSFASVRPTSCSGWFNGCSYLTAIEGLEYLNTSQVTTMDGMFNYCSSLTSLDLSGFNTAKVTDMYGMFYECSSLEAIYVSDGWTTDNVESGDEMFAGCTSLVGGQGTEYDIYHIDMDYARIDGGEENPGYLTPNTMKPTPQVIWCEGNNTLYFINSATVYAARDTYDGATITSVWSGTDVTATPTEGFPEFTNAVSGACTRVVFDESFASVRPTSCFGWFDGCSYLTAIEGLAYLNTSLVTTMNGMFAYCSSLTSLDLSGFNTTNVTTMGHMFENCSSLETLDLSGFNTANVTEMDLMFYWCRSLETLDLSGFNTTNVTTMGHMFEYCSSLEALDLSGFNTAKVTDMDYMFSYCRSLEAIYVSNSWTTENVNSSYDMFDGCTSLVGGQGTAYSADHIDMEYAHIDGIGGRGYLTQKLPQVIWCEGNTTLYFINSETVYATDDTYDNQTVTQVWSGDDVTATPTDDNPAFYDDVNDACTRVVFDKSFASVRPTSCYGWFAWFNDLMAIEGLAYLNTTEVTTTREMFCYGLSLTSLDLSSFNTAKVTEMDDMFSGCSSLKTIYVSDGWTTDNVESGDEMFAGCTSLVGGQGTEYSEDHIDMDYAHIDGGEDNHGYLTSDTMKPTPQAIWCEGNTTLYFINAAKVGGTYDGHPVTAVWSGEAVTATPTNDCPGFSYAVDKYCTRVVFDESFASVRPTSCNGWFDGFRNLTSIEGLAYLNTSEVTNMGEMFNYCQSLKTLDLSSFNTAKVTNMGSMFNNCSKLQSLDLSGFNTAKVMDMAHMFYNCSSLETLDLSSFNTAKVTNMWGMFQNCESLESLDLSSFNTAKVTDMSYMFSYCSSLQTIFVSDSWTTANETESENMFGDCENLVGGQGTEYDEDHTDKTYARIDDVEGPGYLTFGITLVDNDTKKPERERNSDVIDAYCGQTTNVTLAGRTLYKDGEWNTICLPFNVTLEGSPLEGAIAKTLTGATMTGTHVTLAFGNPDSETEPVTTLKAGVPYIIKWEADTEQPTITNPTFKDVELAGDSYIEPITMADGHVQFIGYYDAFTIDTPANDDIYYMTTGSLLKHTAKARTLKACRAYFHFSEAAAARQFILDFGSEASAIECIDGSRSHADALYDLGGRRIEGRKAADGQLRKGLYIRNGHKVFIK